MCSSCSALASCWMAIVSSTSMLSSSWYIWSARGCVTDAEIWLNMPFICPQLRCPSPGERMPRKKEGSRVRRAC